MSKFLNHLDINLQQLKRATFEKLAAQPAVATEGRFYYDTVLQKVRVADGTNWHNLGGDPILVTMQPSPGMAGIITIDDLDPENLIIEISDANASNAGLMTSSQVTLLEDATSGATANKLVKRDSNGFLTGITPVLDEHFATKGYVDSLVSSGMRVVGGLDASEDPDYPVAQQGDAYKITVAGLVGGASGESVAVGDMVLCVTSTVAGDQATVGTNWIILQANIDAATDQLAGYIRIATDAEVLAGSSTNTAVTPVQVATAISGVFEAYHHVETLAPGSVSYTVDHNLNGAVSVGLYERASGVDVYAGITRTGLNQLVVETSSALAVDLIITVSKAGAQTAASV